MWIRAQLSVFLTPEERMDGFCNNRASYMWIVRTYTNRFEISETYLLPSSRQGQGIKVYSDMRRYAVCRTLQEVVCAR